MSLQTLDGLGQGLKFFHVMQSKNGLVVGERVGVPHFKGALKRDRKRLEKYFDKLKKLELGTTKLRWGCGLKETALMLYCNAKSFKRWRL